jgi:hypothetical protein
MGYTEAEIYEILTGLGFSDSRATPGGVIKASCGCSAKNDRTFVVIPGDPPGYFCHRCRKKGVLPDLVWAAWFDGKLPRSAMKIVMHHYAEWLFGDKTVAPNRLEYVPLAEKPRLKEQDVERPKGFLTGAQLTLSGTLSGTLSEAPKVSEADLLKFQRGPSKYLLSRSISAETQTAYEVKSNPWRSRVVFPIRDWEGALVGYSQRRCYEGPTCPRCMADIGAGNDMRYKCECGMLNAKYLHSTGLKKSTLLYGEWLATPGCAPVIVEGMTDVLNLYEKGLRPPDAVPLAVMGGSASESQVRRLLKYAPFGPIVIIRDHDDPAKYTDLPNGKGPGDMMAEALEATIKLVSPGMEVLHVIPPMGMDPGDLSHAQVSIVLQAIKQETSGILSL